MVKSIETLSQSKITADNLLESTVVCPMSTRTVFLNAVNDRRRLSLLIKFLRVHGEKKYANNYQELSLLKFDYLNLLMTVKDLFNESSGRLVCFMSTQPSVGLGIVKKGDGKPENLYKPKNLLYTKMGLALIEKSVAIDLCVSSDKSVEFELSTIAEPSQLTGGTVYFYRDFDINSDSEKFYYQLFRNLTVQRSFDVACRLRSSAKIHIQNYATPAGTKHTLDFRLPNLKNDDTIVANLKVQENLTDSHVYFQFVCLHTTPINQRIIRLINLKLSVANEINSFIKSIDNDSYVFSRLQSQLQLAAQYGKRDSCDKIMKKAVSMFAFYRYDAGGSYDTREFALPERLRNFPLFFSSMLKEPCFNPKLKVSSSESFSNLTQLRSLPFASLLYKLYPKILDMGELHNELAENPETEFGYQVDGKTVLANSIPANVKMVKIDGIYLIDDGEYIFIYVKKEAPTELLMDLLGVPDFESAKEIKNLPYIEESDFSIRINSMIDRLREIKTGEFLTTLVICEGDRNVRKLKYVFMEDLGTQWSNNYWEFLSHLHEKVKDTE